MQGANCQERVINRAELVGRDHQDFAIEPTDNIQSGAILGQGCEQAAGAFDEGDE